MTTLQAICLTVNLCCVLMLVVGIRIHNKKRAMYWLTGLHELYNHKYEEWGEKGYDISDMFDRLEKTMKDDSPKEMVY